MGELIVALIFGIGTPAAWSIAAFRRYRAWREHHDVRSIRELLAVFALWLASCATGVAIFLALTSDGQSTDVRRLLFGVAGGMYLAAGVVFAIEQPRERVHRKA